MYLQFLKSAEYNKIYCSPFEGELLFKIRVNSEEIKEVVVPSVRLYFLFIFGFLSVSVMIT